MNDHKQEIPAFSFRVPRGSSWLIERGLAGFKPFSPLQPWHYLDAKTVFNVQEKWSSGVAASEQFVAFARRQDSDDLACFAVEGGIAKEVVVIHGWTSAGYDLVSRHDSFWDWMKSVIDDIAECVEAISESADETP
jgi:hypothetical protein